MTKLSQIKPRELLTALQRMGFVIKRKEGSHFRLIHPDGRRVTVAFHNKPVSRGTLGAIIRQAESSVEEISKNL